MNKQQYTVDGREATFYAAADSDRPLILLNTYSGDGSSVIEAAHEISDADFNLLCVGNLKWDHDMTPWCCPPLSPQDSPCTGGADEYLDLLVSKMLPKAKKLAKGTPPHVGIAGYSLAGLFALYAMYQTDVFDRAASMSASLWFPDFMDYCLSHAMKRVPDKIYLSLGDKEAKTRHPLLKTVQHRTESLAAHYSALGFDVTWELNPGNHFKDAAARSAKGILAML